MTENFHKPSDESGSSGVRIEGGIDAIVVGATIDGMIAAAYLGKAGLNTVLLEAGALSPELRPFTPGYFADDGDFLLRDLDPKVIDTLKLYRHGLKFVQRRFDSVYYFSDKSGLKVNGDLFRSYESIAEMDVVDAKEFKKFTEQMLSAARELRPMFRGEPLRKVSKQTRALFAKYGTSSIDAVLDDFFVSDRIKDMLSAEASLRSSLKPSDPHSFLSLLRRWSGEAAGLQAACSLPEGGYGGLYEALRRAVKKAGVEVRDGVGIKSILVEWDQAAGVELEDGGQIRAPVVVNGLDGRQVFLEQLGPKLIDIEFHKAVDPVTPKFGAAKVHFALHGTPRDEKTKKNLSRRLVYTPARSEMRQAYRMAREGEVAPELLMELVFPNVFEEGWAPPNGSLAAGWLHPIPYMDNPDEKLRRDVEEVAIAMMEKIAPGARERIEAVDVVLANDLSDRSGLSPESFAASDAVATEARLARVIKGASGIGGVFFCGPEAQVGHGVSGVAGRGAGLAAVEYSRRKGRAA